MHTSHRRGKHINGLPWYLSEDAIIPSSADASIIEFNSQLLVSKKVANDNKISQSQPRYSPEPNHDCESTHKHSSTSNHKSTSDRRYIRYLNQHTDDFIPFTGSIEDLKQMASGNLLTAEPSTNQSFHFYSVRTLLLPLFLVVFICIIVLWWRQRKSIQIFKSLERFATKRSCWMKSFDLHKTGHSKGTADIVSNDTLQACITQNEAQMNLVSSIHMVAEKYELLGLEPQKALELSVQHNFMIQKTQRDEHLRRIEQSRDELKKKAKEGCERVRIKAFEVAFGMFHFITCVVIAYSTHILMKRRDVVTGALYRNREFKARSMIATFLQACRSWWSYEICGCSSQVSPQDASDTAVTNRWTFVGASYVSGAISSVFPAHSISRCEVQCVSSFLPLFLTHRITAYFIPDFIHHMATRFLVFGSVFVNTPIGVSVLQLAYSILCTNVFLCIITNLIRHQACRKIDAAINDEYDLKGVGGLMESISPLIYTVSYVFACLYGATII